jgi:hypothetical protein
MKSVLIQTGADEFHEIYVIDRPWPALGSVDESEVTRAGNVDILSSDYWDGGNQVLHTEADFAFFDESGPIRLDPAPVQQAGQKAVPGQIWLSASGFDFPSLTWRAAVNMGGRKVTCCQGSVTVSFRIERNGLIVPTGAKYYPPSDASWQRYAYTAKGYYSDIAPAHFRSYFLVHPCLRGDPEGGLIKCPAQKAPSEAFNARTELLEVGKIGDFSVFDLNYYFADQDHPRDAPGMRSVLIQTGPDQFQEILAIEAFGEMPLGVGASAIFQAGSGQILRAITRESGYREPPFEIYFALFDEGAVQLDFDGLPYAAQSAIPDGKGKIWPLSAKFDFPSLTWTVGVKGEGENVTCCQGSVTVAFRIERTETVVPTGAKYEPQPGR